MGIFRFDTMDESWRSRKTQTAAPQGDRTQHSSRRDISQHTDEQPFMASMGVYVFSREVLLEILENESGIDFGRELIPGALQNTA
jgi:ADP-glucose pyrophosphorylase